MWEELRELRMFLFLVLVLWVQVPPACMQQDGKDPLLQEYSDYYYDLYYGDYSYDVPGNRFLSTNLPFLPFSILSYYPSHFTFSLL